MEVVRVEGDLFIKSNIVRQDKYLLDVVLSCLYLMVQLFYESSDDEQNVIVKTGYGVIKDSNAIRGHT